VIVTPPSTPGTAVLGKSSLPVTGPSPLPLSSPPHSPSPLPPQESEISSKRRKKQLQGDDRKRLKEGKLVFC
jgi:hypothetical protein